MDICIKPITKKTLRKYLEVEDLIHGKKNHAVKLLYSKIKEYIEQIHPTSEVQVYNLNPIVKVEDNYDNLLIPKDNISRSSTYTHYVDKSRVLRTHTSAQIPSILEDLSRKDNWSDVIIMLPGLVYRRDVSDRIHIGVIHQLDIWRIVKGNVVTKDEWMKVIHSLTSLCAPKWKERIINSPHPYTNCGIEVSVKKGKRIIEILESGLIKERILTNAGLNPKTHSGWAMGMGLDRLVMVKKNIPDIRYLRSTNPEIAKQMKDLRKYHEVSHQPAVRRDMSYCVPQTHVKEDINEDIRNALGSKVDILESVEVISTTRYKDLKQGVRDRLGCAINQKNVLVRITLRHLSKTLTKKQANNVYDQIYRKINYGSGGYLVK